MEFTASSARETTGRIAIIIAATLCVGLFHSWIVQAGESPIRLRVDTSTIKTTTLSGSGDSDASTTGDTGSRVLGLEITVDDAAALFDMGAQFLDARIPEDYDTLHVAGAFYLTSEMITEGDDVPQVIDILDPGTPIVVYCTGGDCEASHNLVTYLQPLGFTIMHIMVDGFDAWADAGHPTEAGAETRLEFEN